MKTSFSNISRFLRITSLVTLLFLVGCKEKPHSAGEILKQDASGTALVVTKYYYSINISGMMLYFSDVNADGTLENLTSDVSEITAKASACFGTGFFVSRYGEILTSRDVVRPELGKRKTDALYGQLQGKLRSALEAMKDVAEEKYNQYYAGWLTGAYGYDFRTVQPQLQELEENFNGYKAAIESLNALDPSSLKVSTSCRINVALCDELFADGHKGRATFAEAHVTKVSGLDDVPLAVVQIGDKKTPKGRYVFHFMESAPRGRRTLLETFWKRARSVSDGREVKDGTNVCMIYGRSQEQRAARRVFSRERPGGHKGRTLRTGVFTAENIPESECGMLIAEGNAAWKNISGGGRRLYFVPKTSAPLSGITAGSPVLNMYNDVVGVYSRNGIIVSVGDIKNFLDIRQ